MPVTFLTSATLAMAIDGNKAKSFIAKAEAVGKVRAVVVWASPDVTQATPAIRSGSIASFLETPAEHDPQEFAALERTANGPISPIMGAALPIRG
jgi:hypothetical protein